MKKQIRNILLIITAFFFTAFFCLLPNLQALLVDWKVQYKKLYTHIAKKKNDTNVMNVSDVSDVQNLLIWYIALAPENQGKEEKSVNLIMDAYTNQILALDVYSDHY